MSDWFENLTGFVEQDFDYTLSSLDVQGPYLMSKVNQAKHLIGKFECLSLSILRERVSVLEPSSTISTVTHVYGDVRDLHTDPINHGALFQVASQFNMLEMIGPHISRRDGVTRYQSDHTQGPACAISVGAATIFRNYFCDDMDGLARVADLFETECPWKMQNGYALCTLEGLNAIANYIEQGGEVAKDAIRSRIAYGIHWNAGVTNSCNIVAQIFCSALPVSYGCYNGNWEPFARVVLEAAYEATLLAAALAPRPPDTTRVVYLTHLGGGAFGNHTHWIEDAIKRAVQKTEHLGLNIRVVHRHAMQQLLTQQQSKLLNEIEALYHKQTQLVEKITYPMEIEEKTTA